MDNKKLFEGLLKADGINPSGVSEAEHVAFTKMLDQQSKSKHSKPGSARPNIWRIIMKSKITKFAAAAVIIIAILIGINQFGGSIDGSSRAYAMTDVPELFYSARNIHMKAIMYFPEGGEDADSAVIEVEHWLDI